MDTLEDYVTELVPVADWEWWLWRVTYRTDFGQTRSRFVVSTDDFLDLDVQDRWPSEFFTNYTADLMARCAAPRLLWCAARKCQYPEDPFTAGEREAARLGIQLTDPVPEIYAQPA